MYYQICHDEHIDLHFESIRIVSPSYLSDSLDTSVFYVIYWGSTHWPHT